MVAVGVRQLKNQLTRYLRLAEKGQSVLVTNRNRPIAVLRKPDSNSARTEGEVVAALAARGEARAGGQTRAFQAVQASEDKGQAVFPDDH